MQAFDNVIQSKS